MRCGAGDDFNNAIRLELSKCPDNIAVDFPCVKIQRLREPGVIMPRHIAHRGVMRRAFDLHRRQLDPARQVSLGAPLQEGIPQHRAKWRSERKGEPHGGLVCHQAAKIFQKRNVTLDDGLKEPVLLEEFFMFWMPHPRQVGVQEEGKGTLMHGNRTTT